MGILIIMQQSVPAADMWAYTFLLAGAHSLYTIIYMQ